MACERCGAQIAMDTLRVLPTFRAPNGQQLFLTITITGAHDALRTRGAAFCESCWGSFFEALGPIGEALRLKGVTSTAQRRLD